MQSNCEMTPKGDNKTFMEKKAQEDNAWVMPTLKRFSLHVRLFYSNTKIYICQTALWTVTQPFQNTAP